MVNSGAQEELAVLATLVKPVWSNTNPVVNSGAAMESEGVDKPEKAVESEGVNKPEKAMESEGVNKPEKTMESEGVDKQ